MRIAIDAMGGDHAPDPIVAGSLEALAAAPELQLTLCGDVDLLAPLVESAPQLADRITYDHTTDVVGMHESPAKAIRDKPNSSINRCWKLLAQGAVDGIVSAGNTGAVVAGGSHPRTRRFLKGIRRPGIAVTIPTPTGSSVMLDVGANVHPKPEDLFQYGIMGSVFAKQMFGIERPSIGLLNVGSEEAKGNGLAKQAAALFQNSPIRGAFHGNIEGRDLLSGQVDVIVCDGFVGNIVLKTCEGMIDFAVRAIGQEVLGALDSERELAKQALLSVHNRYHHSEFGGAPLLGIDGVCMICHGGSDSRAIRNAIRTATRFNVVNKLIVGQMADALTGAKVAAEL